jgi:hypothetical protein
MKVGAVAQNLLREFRNPTAHISYYTRDFSINGSQMDLTQAVGSVSFQAILRVCLVRE